MASFLEQKRSKTVTNIVKFTVNLIFSFINVVVVLIVVAVVVFVQQSFNNVGGILL